MTARMRHRWAFRAVTLEGVPGNARPAGHARG
jgi:hypothetical protein